MTLKNLIYVLDVFWVMVIKHLPLGDPSCEYLLVLREVVSLAFPWEAMAEKERGFTDLVNSMLEYFRKLLDNLTKACCRCVATGQGS